MNADPAEDRPTAATEETATMTHPDSAREITTTRRPLDVTSLVAGVVVLAIAAAFAVGDPDSLHDQGRVVGPLVLLGVGVALLVGSLRR